MLKRNHKYIKKLGNNFENIAMKIENSKNYLHNSNFCLIFLKNVWNEKFENSIKKSFSEYKNRRKLNFPSQHHIDFLRHGFSCVVAGGVREGTHLWTPPKSH